MLLGNLLPTLPPCSPQCPPHHVVCYLLGCEPRKASTLSQHLATRRCGKWSPSGKVARSTWTLLPGAVKTGWKCRVWPLLPAEEVLECPGGSLARVPRLSGALGGLLWLHSPAVQLPSGSFLVTRSHFLLSFVQVDGILKTVLRDEIIAWHKKTQEDTSSPLSAAGQPENMDSQQLVSLVQKAVTAIMTRLHNLAQFEGGESKVNTLVAAANSLDNLCRMDPAWHPWL